MMGVEFQKDLEQLLLYKPAKIENDEGQWSLSIGENLRIFIVLQWRLRDENYIRVACDDDGHKFGLDEPVDCLKEANRILCGNHISSVNFNKITGDITIGISNNFWLDIWTGSRGYESWRIYIDDEFFAAGANGGLV